MGKISISFLVGFAMIASVGAASAQSATDAAAMSNSLNSEVLSREGMRASAKLSEAKEANPFASAASSLGGAPTGTGINIPTVKAKLGDGLAISLPTNALTDASQSASMNMANALQGTQPAGDGDSLKSTLVLGTSVPDMSNMIGEDIRSGQRLGR